MGTSKTPVHDPAVEFSGLILGFSSAVLYYLGENSIDGKKALEENIPLAKHNIEILELLKNKTKGNLTKEEDDLLNQVLSDLKIKFVEAQKSR